jgi:hypothetical protein
MKMQKTINDFIKELQQISEEKRELPLIIAAPNGQEVSPNIKMVWDNPMDFGKTKPNKMLISWRD